MIFQYLLVEFQASCTQEQVLTGPVVVNDFQPSVLGQAELASTAITTLLGRLGPLVDVV